MLIIYDDNTYNNNDICFYYLNINMIYCCFVIIQKDVQYFLLKVTLSISVNDSFIIIVIIIIKFYCCFQIKQ